MSIKFEWEGEEPAHPSAKQVVEAFEYDLSHMPDEHSLCPLVTSVLLRQNETRSRIEGVGFSEEKEPLLTFFYELHKVNGGWPHRWDYYNDVLRSKP